MVVLKKNINVTYHVPVAQKYPAILSISKHVPSPGGLMQIRIHLQYINYIMYLMVTFSNENSRY